MVAKPKTNMYEDSKYNWGIFSGCKFDCLYCRKSFQKLMARNQYCEKCRKYEPHFHLERLYKKLPLTVGDEFIRVGGASDVCFMSNNDLKLVMKRMDDMDMRDRTFFFQSKDPYFFHNLSDNIVTEEFLRRHRDRLLFGITLETNRDEGYTEVSRAPLPSYRAKSFAKYRATYPDARLSVTVEPILDFDLPKFVEMIRLIRPERVYVGYDSKNCGLNEPPVEKTLDLIKELEKFTKAKRKRIPETRAINRASALDLRED